MQVRGNLQAMKNAEDGISLIRIAEGALNQIHEILQRGRELSIQAANDTLSDTERGYLQQEISHVIDEIDRINESTNFNTRRVLTSGVSSGDYDDILTGLKTSWLEQGELRILAQYGLAGDNQDLTIKIDSEISGALAYVRYTIGGDGKGSNLELHIDANEFTPATLPNGGTAPFYDDRIVAHELVHAIMARTMNVADIPRWFHEGTAELIHGGDERVAGDQTHYADQEIINAIGDGTDATWINDSVHYSSGYIAARYLHDRLKNAGGAGIQDIMGYLSTNPTDDLDDALRNIASGSYAGGLAGFVADFTANGAAFIASDINTANADTGAIGSLDTGDNGAFDAAAVIPDVNNPQDDPLAGFATVFAENEGLLKLHIGPNDKSDDELDLILSDSSSRTLGIDQVNVGIQNGAVAAIGSFDDAIALVSQTRTNFGVMENRLAHALNNLHVSATNQQFSESVIRDADFAYEATELTKRQIIDRSSIAMIAQANLVHVGVLRLVSM